jgi:tRNA threonylcarbamoyladenosine biosynthesis protein TsaE
MDAIFSLPQIGQVAAQLWKEGKSSRVWAFDAAMGSGKTTFIHALCEYLQVKDTVSSPTFALVNEYQSPVAGVIYHMDWYRLKDTEEAIDAGIEDQLRSGQYCFVEWPAKAADLLPDNCFYVHIETLDPQTRRLFTGMEEV